MPQIKHTAAIAASECVRLAESGWGGAVKDEHGEIAVGTNVEMLVQVPFASPKS